MRFTGGRTVAPVRVAAGHANLAVTSIYLQIAVEDDRGVATKVYKSVNELPLPASSSCAPHSSFLLCFLPLDSNLQNSHAGAVIRHWHGRDEIIGDDPDSWSVRADDGADELTIVPQFDDGLARCDGGRLGAKLGLQKAPIFQRTTRYTSRCSTPRENQAKRVPDIVIGSHLPQAVEAAPPAAMIALPGTKQAGH
jgi:hypothetical protein